MVQDISNVEVHYFVEEPPSQETFLWLCRLKVYGEPSESQLPCPTASTTNYNPPALLRARKLSSGPTPVFRRGATFLLMTFVKRVNWAHSIYYWPSLVHWSGDSGPALPLTEHFHVLFYRYVLLRALASLYILKSNIFVLLKWILVINGDYIPYQ